ncbi:MAG: toxin [Mycoplasma sp.]|nr:toxin [Mycoplasma sp.]
MPNPPKFVYRIDTRKPEVIFETGFNPVGNVRDFFTHILGERMRDNYFISTSETVTAALRFFASWLDEPIGREEVYLYEIRADHTFYNARTTGENFLDRVLNNQITYQHGNRDDALFCINLLRGDFAYQREWFSEGPIAREQIVRAWRVDMVEVDPRHVRHTGREFSQALPRINDPEIVNNHYQDQPTHANPNPWDNAPSAQAPSTVSIPENVELADIAEGVSASMSFACPNPDSTNRNKRDLNNNLQCIAQTFVEYKLKDAPEYAPSYKKLNARALYLATQDLKFKFKLSMENKRKTFPTIISIKQNNKNEETKIIYDTNERLCKYIKDCNKEIQLALTLQYNPKQVGIFEVISEVSIINDPAQKWYLSPIDDINTIFRVSSKSLPNTETGLFTKKNSKNQFDQKLYVLPINSSLKDDYEELFIVLGDEFNDISFPVTSASQTHLIDIGMCWESKGFYYRPLVSGYSKAKKTKPYEIFYDLRSSKIVFINNNSKIYCLRNKLDPTLAAGWDWIEWKESDFSIQDNSTKWYFSRGNLDIPDIRGLNKRYIRSYKNNDYLKVIYSGIRWGSWYTTKYEKDSNSVMVFVVDEFVDK